MKTIRVYLDTSVVGGCLDPEFAPWSRGLVDDCRAGRVRPVLSDVLAAELAGAPVAVQAVYADLRTMAPQLIGTSPEALALLAAYERATVLGPRYRNDMLHIALATVAEADVLVSWNFRHIVRVDKIRLFDAVSTAEGYRPVTIRSPREVTTYGRDPDPAL